MNLRIDLRDTRIEDLTETVVGFSPNVTFLVTAWQWSAWRRSETSVGRISSRMLVMVPDFLYYARLVGAGQAGEIIKLPRSVTNLLKSGLSCVPTGIARFPGLARGRFWDAAEAMLAYDLGLLERNFAGEVLLHYNLADFAWSFERRSFIEAFFRKTRSRVGRGIATQQLASAASLCSRWNLPPSRFLYTTGISRPETLMINTARKRQFAETSWTVDLTQWPVEVLCENDLFEFHRETDDEWLVSLAAGKQLSSLGI